MKMSKEETSPKEAYETSESKETYKKPGAKAKKMGKIHHGLYKKSKVLKKRPGDAFQPKSGPKINPFATL